MHTLISVDRDAGNLAIRISSPLLTVLMAHILSDLLFILALDENVKLHRNPPSRFLIFQMTH